MSGRFTADQVYKDFLRGLEDAYSTGPGLVCGTRLAVAG